MAKRNKVKLKHIKQIRNGIAVGKDVYFWMPEDIQVRWLSTNPVGYPKRSIYAARRTYARLTRKYNH